MSNVYKEKKDIRVSFRITEEMLAEVNALAKRKRCDVSQLIRDALTRMIGERGAK